MIKRSSLASLDAPQTKALAHGANRQSGYPWSLPLLVLAAMALGILMGWVSVPLAVNATTAPSAEIAASFDAATPVTRAQPATAFRTCTLSGPDTISAPAIAALEPADVSR